MISDDLLNTIEKEIDRIGDAYQKSTDEREIIHLLQSLKFNRGLHQFVKNNRDYCAEIVKISLEKLCN